MTFQAYIDNIQLKTGRTPEEFRELARQTGLLRADLKAAEFVGWLKKDFGLGHGHAMAMLELFKRRNWVKLTSSRARK